MGLVAGRHAGHAFGGHLDEAGADLLAEVHERADTAVVDRFDVVALREVLHVGRAVEHHVEMGFVCNELVKDFRLGDVTLDHLDTSADELAVGLVEIVHEHLGEPAVGAQGALAAQQTPDGRVFGRHLQ